MLQFSDIHGHDEAGGGSQLVILGGAVAGEAIARELAVVQDEDGYALPGAHSLERLQGPSGVVAGGQRAAGDGGLEGVHHDEASAGPVNPMLNGGKRFILVDGQVLVARVEREGGVHDGGLLEQHVALGGGFLGGDPEDGALLGLASGEGGPGGDGEGKGGGEAGFAFLGLGDEHAEVVRGYETLDEPFGSVSTEATVEDFKEESAKVVLAGADALFDGDGVPKVGIKICLFFSAHIYRGQKTRFCQPTFAQIGCIFWTQRRACRGRSGDEVLYQRLDVSAQGRVEDDEEESPDVRVPCALFDGAMASHMLGQGLLFYSAQIYERRKTLLCRPRSFGN